jgi:hypothetical protein
VQVKLVNTTDVEIRIPVWHLIKPITLQGGNQEAFDPNDTGIYVDKVALYREWIDPSKAITIMRRTDVGCSCTTTTDVCYTCENVTACVVNAERGMIALDMRNTDANSCYCNKCAHRICINYVAGDCNNHKQIIAHLAATYLCKSLCCSPSEELKRWQADYVGVDQRGRITTSLSQLELGNPFGTLRGQIEAYRYLRQRRKMKAVRV